jgi:hypothetical protein
VSLLLHAVPVFAQIQEQPDVGVSFDVVVIVILLAFVVNWLSKVISTRQDRSWLPRLIVWGFVAKMIGTLARFWMVTVLYGTGDSYRYHLFGAIESNVWQNFRVPVGTSGGPGTAFTEVVTSFLYALYTPSFLGGFVLFAFLSYLGQLFFFSAFRPWFGQEKARLYAYAVFFLPSLVFWPAGIGKDALMVFSLGMAAYGVSRLLREYQIGALFLIAPALYLAASIRAHVAGIFGIATVLAMLLGKAPRKMQGHPKRALMILSALGGAAILLATFSATFEVTVEGTGATRDTSEFLSDVNEQTSTGGSQIEGGGIASPAQLPLAVVTVLFRPLIHEGTSLQVIVSALEGTALLLFTIWKLPTIWRNKRLLREKPYLMMTFFYTGGFIVAFSAILNLGILARQRVQVLPFFLALLVGLAWDEPKKGESESEAKRVGRDVPRRPPARVTQEASVTEPADSEIQAEKALPASQSRSPQARKSSATTPANGRHQRR